jgi:hypothetical protein
LDFCFVMCKNRKCNLFLPNIVTLWEFCNNSTLGEELVWQVMHFILHYLHVNFKSLVMKEEEHPNNIDTMERHSKMLGLCKIFIANPPQGQLFSCLHFIPTLNKFISHIWYIASFLLWFNYDPFIICFIPNACFKFRKWHLTYFHHKNLERKSTLGSK